MFLTTAFAASLITGTVSYVNDGDTFVLDVESSQEAVRLWGIDAPESEQPGGVPARTVLRELIDGKPLSCTGLYRDQYKRIVAVCTVDGSDIAALLVETGYAMDYPRYSKGHYAQMQAKAKSQKRGLWSGDFRKPWQWRKSKPVKGEK